MYSAVFLQFHAGLYDHSVFIHLQYTNKSYSDMIHEEEDVTKQVRNKL